MDELILRVLSGEATRFEEERLKRWRTEHTGNEARFQDLSRLWDLTRTVEPSEVAPKEVDRLASSILSAAEDRRREKNEETRLSPVAAPRKRSIRTYAPWAAALAATVAALSFGLRSQTPNQGGAPPSPAPVSIALSAQTLRLDDGSFVRLSPGSRLEAHLGPEERVVHLEGKAFFAVAPDGGRPFVVSTDQAQVKVLGTRFEVAQDTGSLRTVVVEGRVRLSSSEGEVEVPEGSVGFAESGATPTAVPVEDPLSLLDWPGGLLVFHDTPLGHVAREVQRHFQLPVKLESATSSATRVSASFEEGESFQEVVETLCSITRSLCRIWADSAVVGPPTGEAR